MNTVALLSFGVATMAPDLASQRGGLRMLERTQLVERFDADKNGRLDAGERAAARKWVEENGQRRRGGFRSRRRGVAEAVTPSTGDPIDPDSVRHYPDAGFYDQTVLRTVFLRFPGENWRAELSDFYRTDVELPATMTVDGKEYGGVGVRYRGSSSYLFVAANKKKSVNISVDFTNGKQRVHGNRTLNLLNCNADASLLREALFSHVAGHYVPTLRVNYMKLVVNGANEGIYANVQQFNKDFLAAAFGNRKGIRWKILRNFGGAGALTYRGDDRADYERAYERKTGKDPKSWQRLIRFCKLLDETPVAKMESVLPAVLDIDRTLWFLALEWVFMDGDGYVKQGYDYRLFEDKHGRFLPIAYDNNEILPRSQGGFSGRGARGQRPFGDDPLEQTDNRERPLISRLLAVPAWRARYLAHVHTLASHWLDWQNLGPVCQRFHDLISKEVKHDPRKLYSFQRFERGLKELEGRVTDRRERVLGHASLKGPWPEIGALSRVEVPAGSGKTRLRIQAKISTAAPVANVILYVRTRRRALFRAIVMHDDGEHGDGAAGDGVYAAATKPYAPGTKIHHYVEARAPRPVGTTAFRPDRGEGGTAIYRLEK